MTRLSLDIARADLNHAVGAGELARQQTDIEGYLAPRAA